MYKEKIIEKLICPITFGPPCIWANNVILNELAKLISSTVNGALQTFYYSSIPIQPIGHHNKTIGDDLNMNSYASDRERFNNS